MADLLSLDAAVRAAFRDVLRDELRAELADIRARLDALTAAAPPALVTIDVAAERLAKSPSTVRAMCAAGELPARRVGRSWRVDLAALRPTEPAEIARLARVARSGS
jgi:excisionase family DNA binding protein